MTSFILILLVGGLFFWLFISSNKGSFTTNEAKLSFKTVLYSEFGYIIALIAKLAKSDGHVSDLEAELIENILDDICDEFENKNQARIYLKEIFKEEKEIQDNVDHVASELYKQISYDVYKQQKIIEFMVTLAFIDGELHAREKATILEIAQAFHMDQAAVESFFHQYHDFYEDRSTHHNQEQINEEAFYKLLDIDSNYDKQTLKRAYKKGVKEHHPDVIMGKGGSKEDIQQATQKLQDINEAYEYFKKKKGF
jgi:DnaJ like chaperone protein